MSNFGDITRRNFLHNVRLSCCIYWCIGDFHKDIKFVFFGEFSRISFMGGSHMVACFIRFSIEKEIPFVFFVELWTHRRECVHAVSIPTGQDLFGQRMKNLGYLRIDRSQ